MSNFTIRGHYIRRVIIVMQHVMVTDDSGNGWEVAEEEPMDHEYQDWFYAIGFKENKLYPTMEDLRKAIEKETK